MLICTGFKLLREYLGSFARIQVIKRGSLVAIESMTFLLFITLILPLAYLEGNLYSNVAKVEWKEI
jgi:hypothetical protein